MRKTFLEKIIRDEDLKETSFNTLGFWILGKTANVIANSVFHFDLNKYNSIDHLTLGVGIGTLSYRKAGGGVKGVIAGLTAATLLNAGWEYFENKYVFKDANGLTSIDTISDIAVVYSGSVLGFLSEKTKKHINRKNEKWVM